MGEPKIYWVFDGGFSAGISESADSVFGCRLAQRLAFRRILGEEISAARSRGRFFGDHLRLADLAELGASIGDCVHGEAVAAGAPNRRFHRAFCEVVAQRVYLRRG